MEEKLQIINSKSIDSHWSKLYGIKTKLRKVIQSFRTQKYMGKCLLSSS